MSDPTAEQSLREFVHVGPYALGEAIGRGPLGVAYAAFHRETGERVVVRGFEKPPNADEEQWQRAIERFTQELEAASRLDHPGIVRLIDFGQLDGHYYIATENLRVETLRHRLDRAPRLLWEEMLSVVRQVAEVIDYADSMGAYHGDLTPHNLLLLPTRQVKVLNYGMGHVRSKRGSPYRAPEQAAGHRGDRRSDLYALGALLYEMLAGTPPFRAETEEQLQHAILKQAPAPIEGIAADLQRAVWRLLAKNPARRYASGAGLIADLARIQPPGRTAEEPPEPGSFFLSWTPPPALALSSLADFNVSESALKEIRLRRARETRIRRRRHARWIAAGVAIAVLAPLLWAARHLVGDLLRRGVRATSDLKSEMVKAGGQMGAAIDTLEASVAIDAIVTALEGHGQYPTSLDPTTLEGLGLPAEEARRLLSAFTGDRLISYRSDGRYYQLRARARDGGALFEVRDGRVEVQEQDAEGGDR